MSDRRRQPLLRGVGVVMDDHVLDDVTQTVGQTLQLELKKLKISTKGLSISVKDGVDQIVRITKTLERYGLPLVKCKKIPVDVDQFIHNLGSVAFLLLDWRYDNTSVFADDDGMEGFQLRSQTLVEQNETNVVAFIGKFMELCTAPIFIVSNESPDSIRRKLAESMGEKVASQIIVERKTVLAKKVIGLIEKWIRKTPSTYVLKLWDNAYHDARNKMFSDFSRASRFWPVPFFKAYEKDDDDPASAFTDLLLRNLRGRMAKVTLDKCPMTRNGGRHDNSTLRSVLELSVITPNESLAESGYGCGDLYVCQDAEGVLYQLNVRCDCDLCHSENPEFLVLNGREIPLPKVKKDKLFSRRDGFCRPLNCAYVFPVNGGKCVCFKFNNCKRVRAKAFLKPDPKNPLSHPKRIGRMLPPYITDIRQRNAQWMQREGFPKIPIQAVR